MRANSGWYDRDHTTLNLSARMDWQAVTAFLPVFATFPTRLRAAADHLELEAGETLFRLGDRLKGVFCVVDGEIRLIRRARNGAEIVLDRSRGGFFAEASLATGEYHCDAVAAEPSAVLRFPVSAFNAVLHKDAKFRDAWIAHLSNEVRKSRAQVERLSLRSAAERIIHYIELEGADGMITLTESRKAWAAELGLTHEALYRTLRRLKADGTLDTHADRIVLGHRSHTGRP